MVRVAAANLNASYVKLEQQLPEGTGSELSAPKLSVTAQHASDATAFALIAGRSHSGEEMGVLRSVKNDGKPHPTVSAVLACLNVKDASGYSQTRRQFAGQNARLRDAERVERHHNRLFPDNFYLHDSYSMIQLRLRDDRGHSVSDFDLLFTGKKNDPSTLPPGFFQDRQRNSRDGGCLSYFVNYDMMNGLPAVDYKGGAAAQTLTRRPATRPAAHPAPGQRFCPLPAGDPQRRAGEYPKVPQTGSDDHGGCGAAAGGASGGV